MTPRSCRTRAPSARAGTLGHFATAAVVCFAAAQLSAQAVWSLASNAEFGSAIAFDAARRQIIQFGMTNGLQNGFVMACTWAWDGATWTRLFPDHSPPARAYHTLTYDPLRQRLVLFGGCNGQVVFNDTWEWDGSDWLQCTPATSPRPRQFHAATFDPVRGRTLLFGGVNYLTNSQSDETWEWDGSNWTLLQPAARPPALWRMAMAYDPLRSRAVLFPRGATFGGNTEDLWEWDGNTWTNRGAVMPQTPTTLCLMAFDAIAGTMLLFDPVMHRTVSWNGATAAVLGQGGPNSAQAITYDSQRNRVVLAGTCSGDVWEWSGSTWVRQQGQPSTYLYSSSVAMGYHAASARTVLLENGTWTWDGGRWTEVLSAAASPSMSSAAMAEDGPRNCAVLFGTGQLNNLSPLQAMTWEWSGSAWTRRQPATSPRKRTDHAMVFDTQRSCVVLYGGYDEPVVNTALVLDDTWEYDGQTWTQRFPANRPPALRGHAMAYDQARGQTLLHGGGNDTSYNLDTWEWDGANWTLLQPVNRPRWGWDQAMAYDHGRARVVLFSNDLSPGDASTWEWDGNDWRLAMNLGMPGTTPSRRSAAKMVYDERSSLIVLFGGYATFQGSMVRLMDTWHYGPAAHGATFGAGCPGSLGVPSLALNGGQTPQFGRPCRFDLGNLPHNAALLAAGLSDTAAGPLQIPLPLSLSFVGMPGCDLLVDPAHQELVIGSGNAASYALPIPNAPALTGVQLYLQAFVLDASANALGMTVSNGVRLTIGL